MTPTVNREAPWRAMGIVAIVLLVLVAASFIGMSVYRGIKQGLAVPAAPQEPVYQPTLTLNPAQGTVGTTVTIIGAGFPADRDYHILIGPESVGAHADPVTIVTTDANGAFTATFDVPATWADDTPVTAEPMVIVASSPEIAVSVTQRFVITE